MITVIDYGCGNINAFTNSFKRINVEAIIAKNIYDIESASKIILPGVGAFDYVMSNFNKSGFRDIVEKKVIEEKTPTLGICAGMQILANSSEEGNEKGLGWIKGEVRMFDKNKIKFKTKLPHMGWNSIEPVNNKLLLGLNDQSKFYFVHSYFFDASYDKNIIATTTYGVDFSSAVNEGNIYGVQFHPEKSHNNGLMILKNFSKI